MKSKFILAASSLALLSTSAFGQATVKTNGQKNVIIHESTGAWCGWCVDGAEICDRLVALDPHIIAVSVHNGDGMTFTIGDNWNNACVDGFPSGTIDCKMNAYVSAATKPGTDRGGNWCKPASAGGGDGDVKTTNWYKVSQQQITAGAKYDITMSQSYDQASKVLTVKVDGKALADLTGKYNINVIIMEDNVTGTGSGYDQHNYYQLPQYSSVYTKSPYITKPATITGFVHMRVLRAMLGSTWGADFATDPKTNATATKTFTYTVPDPTKINNMKVVAYLQKSSTDVKDREILNAVQAKMISWNPTNVANVETSNIAELKLFPNPASNVVGVRALLNHPAEAKVTITNSLGQVVFNQSYPAGGSTFGVSVPLDNMSAGLYNVTVTTEGKATSEKLVVSK